MSGEMLAVRMDALWFSCGSSGEAEGAVASPCSSAVL